MYALLDENGYVIQTQPYEEDGYIEVPDDVVCGQKKEGTSYVNPPKQYTVEEAVEELTAAYDAAMRLARNGYTQEEVNTFSIKAESAKAVLKGAGDSLDRVTMAKLEGLINGELPMTSEAINAIDASFTEQDLEAISDRANKIMNADITYRILGGEIERLRNIRYDEIMTGGDPETAINALKSDYQTLYDSLS